MPVKRKATTLVLILLFSAVAGAQLSLSAKANFLFPPSNPRVTITSPTSGTHNVNALSLEVTFETYRSVYEDGQVYNTSRLFTYALDGKNPENITMTNSSIGRNPGDKVFFEGLAHLPELTEGLHNLTVCAVIDYHWDEPNAIHTESELTVYFRIDTAPQNISILMDRDSTYLLTDVPLKFFVDEPASWIGYSLDGQENITITGNTTLPAPSVGQHTLTLYAEDASGNPARSETITFRVADPLPIFLVVAVSVAAIAVLVYFKKRKR